MNKIEECLGVCRQMDELETQLKNNNQPTFNSKELGDLAQKYDQLYESMDRKEKTLFIVKLSGWDKTAQYLEERWKL